MREIRAICPESITYVEVRDNWYPSYKNHNKFYVKAILRAWKIYNPDITERPYVVQLIFCGGDDYMMEKRINVDTIEEATKFYHKYKSFLNKIKKMNSLNLKTFLSRYEFEVW